MKKAFYRSANRKYGVTGERMYHDCVPHGQDTLRILAWAKFRNTGRGMIKDTVRVRVTARRFCFERHSSL